MVRVCTRGHAATDRAASSSRHPCRHQHQHLSAVPNALCRPRTRARPVHVRNPSLPSCAPLPTTHTQLFIMGGQRSASATSMLSVARVEAIDMEDMSVVIRDAEFASLSNATLRARSGHSVVPYRGSVVLVGGAAYNRSAQTYMPLGCVWMAAVARISVACLPA